MSDIQTYIEKNKNRFIKELIELLKIPSVSADPSFKDSVRIAAEAVKSRLIEAGAEDVQLCETKGHPVVFGSKLINPELPTIMVYGHYDVQPADPVELWDSPPFEPVIKSTPIHPDGAIFARGACDDKGQMYMTIKAFEYMMDANDLPCNVKFMIEGEEEIGSAHLGDFIAEYKKDLDCDIILICDTGIINNDTPSITVGLRGMSYVEVEVTGPNRDLHSGLYGGAVANPINILCEMIASLTDANNHITIPGFYEKVIDLTTKEREEMAKAPFSKSAYMSDLEIDDVHGENGYTTLERNSVRPTLDVNGIWGGYIGKGAKTVLPSKAYAKISMRLVPDQTSSEITDLFTAHFEKIAPAGVKVKVTPHHSGEPFATPTDFTGYAAASQAMELTYGKKPIPMRSGGSIPIVAMFEKELGVKSILMGFGLDSDKIHSPNEHYGLFNYFIGIETIPYFFKNFTNLNTK
ncbi:MAG: dipeptidase [Crocinitomicaceae bacterium]|nr:dipeptidase [Crocinitomicaceae bacterium]